MTDQQSLVEAIKAFAEEERQESPLHLAPSDLKAYLADRTNEEETERIRDHLALCRQCADRTLALKRNQAPLKRLVGAVGTMLWSPRFAYGVAAVCLVTAAGVSIWLITPQPQLNVPSVILSLTTERGGSEAEILETNAAHNFLVMLNDSAAADRYSVELLRKTAAGVKKEWSTDQLDGLKEKHYEYLSFILPAGYLKPGSYVVRVFAGDETGRLLGEDTFTVSGNAVE